VSKKFRPFGSPPVHVRLTRKYLSISPSSDSNMDGSLLPLPLTLRVSNVVSFFSYRYKRYTCSFPLFFDQRTKSFFSRDHFFLKRKDVPLSKRSSSPLPPFHCQAGGKIFLRNSLFRLLRFPFRSLHDIEDRRFCLLTSPNAYSHRFHFLSFFFFPPPPSPTGSRGW